LLRFEIGGFITTTIVSISLSPYYYDKIGNIKNISDIFTILSSIITISIIIGYLIHQNVVDYYRSENNPREIHILLEDKIEKIYSQFFNNKTQKEKIAFLSSLYDLLCNVEDIGCQKVGSKISSRWSHFYARKSAKFSIYFSLILYASCYVFIFYYDQFTLNKFVVSIIWFILMQLFFIWTLDPYTNKLWLEINHLEVLSIINNKKVDNYIEEITSDFKKSDFKYFYKEIEFKKTGILEKWYCKLKKWILYLMKKR